MRTNTPAATLAFDRLAPEYDALANGEIFQLLRRRTHETFARRFRPGARVLEIGCGTGLDTAFLANAGVRVVACDPSEAMVGRSRDGAALRVAGCDRLSRGR
jgi:ubiquinone/menaquinone biosynthesis C-methylase UbiE